MTDAEASLLFDVIRDNRTLTSLTVRGTCACDRLRFARRPMFATGVYNLNRFDSALVELWDALSSEC
jgi:hypothetical protein